MARQLANKACGSWFESSHPDKTLNANNQRVI
nr:MAG TPA: hypothetical protein [Caudoviricetes sp.]DAN91548.1 MAG TPA: hypothetical protein [Caudoviricetes sp.]